MLLKGQLLGLSLLQLGDPGKGLVAKAGSTPVLADFVSPLVEVGLNGLDQLVERTLILGFDLLENDLKKSMYLSSLLSYHFVENPFIPDWQTTSSMPITVYATELQGNCNRDSGIRKNVKLTNIKQPRNI